MGKQYTIRAVPDSIDRSLRRLAKEQDKSLNSVAIETLARGLELSAKPGTYSDLDFLIGSWQEDAAFDAAVAEFQRVDEEDWK